MKFFSLLLFLIITSCAHLTKEECQSKDWAAQGKKDGLSGNASSNFSKYKNLCQEHGISISRLNYEDGFKLGLKEYCVFKEGFKSGLNGKREHALCKKISVNYSRGYNEGYKEFLISEKVKKEEEEKQYLRNQEIDNVKSILMSRFSSKTCTFSSDCTTDGYCDFGKCKQTGNSCMYNSDCIKKGVCEEVTQRTKYFDLVSLRVCDFK